MTIGSENDDLGFMEMIESLGATIVIDDQCSGTRNFWNEARPHADPLAAIADRYCARPACPTKDFPLHTRFEHVLGLAREYDVQAAIFLQQKFCDPHAGRLSGAQAASGASRNSDAVSRIRHHQSDPPVPHAHRQAFLEHWPRRICSDGSDKFCPASLPHRTLALLAQSQGIARPLLPRLRNGERGGNSAGRVVDAGCHSLRAGRDVYPLTGEPYAAAIAHDRKFNLACQNATEAAGFARDLCAYMRSYWGSIYLDRYLDGSPFPKPDFNFQTVICSHAQWYQHAARTGKARPRVIDVSVGPYHALTASRLQYVVDQGLNPSPGWEQMTGRVFDDELFIEAVQNEMRSTALWAGNLLSQSGQTRAAGREEPCSRCMLWPRCTSLRAGVPSFMKSCATKWPTAWRAALRP